jgi:hypothetical protein
MPFTGHPDECACGYCSAIRQDCGGQAHDWEDTGHIMTCRNCSAKSVWELAKIGSKAMPIVKIISEE